MLSIECMYGRMIRRRCVGWVINNSNYDASSGRHGPGIQKNGRYSARHRIEERGWDRACPMRTASLLPFSTSTYSCRTSEVEVRTDHERTWENRDLRQGRGGNRGSWRSKPQEEASSCWTLRFECEPGQSPKGPGYHVNLKVRSVLDVQKRNNWE